MSMPEQTSYAPPIETIDPHHRELIRKGEDPLVAAEHLADVIGIGSDSAEWEIVEQWMASLKSHDEATYSHSLRVGVYAGNLALSSSFDYDPGFALKAGCTHDVGKYGIDNTLLNSTDIFTEYNHENVRRHPAIGAFYLDSVDHELALVAGLHHKFQPEGYGIQLPDDWDDDKEARKRVKDMSMLIMVVDYFDAMMTRDDGHTPITEFNAEKREDRLMERFPEYKEHIDWLFDHRIEEVS